VKRENRTRSFRNRAVCQSYTWPLRRTPGDRSGRDAKPDPAGRPSFPRRRKTISL